MRMGWGKSPAPLLSLFKTRKTKIIMGHFDKLQATTLEANKVKAFGPNHALGCKHTLTVIVWLSLDSST